MWPSTLQRLDGVGLCVLALLVCSAANKKDPFMMMFKIFMSYLQFVSLAAGLQVRTQL